MKMAMAMLVAVLGGGVLGGGVLGAQGTSPTVKDDLFNGTEKFAKGASDVTEVTMDPDTLGMVSGRNEHRAHGMVLNVVRTYEYDKPGMYNMAEVEEFRKRLDTGEWHCSVHTRNLKSGESTDICSKHRTDGLVEQAIITVEPKELTFIHTIEHANSRVDAQHGEAPGESMLFAPEMPGLGGWDAASQARLVSMGPAMEAKFAAMGPAMEAGMAGSGERFVSGMRGAPAVPRAPLPPRGPSLP